MYLDTSVRQTVPPQGHSLLAELNDFVSPSFGIFFFFPCPASTGAWVFRCSWWPRSWGPGCVADLHGPPGRILVAFLVFRLLRHNCCPVPCVRHNMPLLPLQRILFSFLAGLDSVPFSSRFFMLSPFKLSCSPPSSLIFSWRPTIFYLAFFGSPGWCRGRQTTRYPAPSAASACYVGGPLFEESPLLDYACARDRGVLSVRLIRPRTVPRSHGPP